MLAFGKTKRAGAALALGMLFAATTAQAQTIVEVASGAGNFKTLVAAVKAAGLVDTLNGKGPFTVFAPTDAAFAALPKGTVETLLKPQNKKKLVAILTYHVVASKINAKDVPTKATHVKTVNGKAVAAKRGKSGVTINTAKVVSADVPASNGVIHAIDKVLLPK
jgi:uncharacterized surface protein with fasciclin (FAS1) repeats